MRGIRSDMLLIYETIISSWGSKTEKLHLPILIEMDEDGYYIVSCQLFRGCHSYGETIDEALENIREVIELCLEETKVKMLNKFVGFSAGSISECLNFP
jgi:predicted RNase H-like HicB family nuclease